jgi:hypothetical protein
MFQQFVSLVANHPLIGFWLALFFLLVLLLARISHRFAEDASKPVENVIRGGIG